MFKRLLIAAAVLGAAAAFIVRTDDDIEIDYGTSSIFSKADMHAAVSAIRKEFRTFKGCELHSIRYAGDACMTSENLKWMNSLGNNGPYAWCIEFKSDFRSPKQPSGAWEPDTEYKDWEWWLARTEDGEWEVLTYGY